MTRSVDWDGRDPPDPRPRRRRRRRADPDRPAPGASVVLPAVGWGLVLTAVALGGAQWVLMLRSANGAVQEASASAMFAAGAVAVYVLARAADRLIGLLAGRGR